MTPVHARKTERTAGLLLLGPADRANRFIGGAVTSFRGFCAFLDREHVAHDVIDTRHFAGRMHGARNLLRVLALCPLKIPEARTVVFFAARNGVLYLSPLIYLLCRFFRTRFCLVPAGGDIADIYGRAPAWQRMILRRTALRADVLLLQTRAALERCRAFVSHPVWFPNSRPRPRAQREPQPYRRRFVFLSQVTEEKGAGILLDAMDLLDASFTVDVFGPLKDAGLRAGFEARGCYRGAVPPGQAPEVLAGYDVLVLPTFAPQEGYPGVLLEAFSVGVPVITTHWLSIPEIVRHGESGLLVPPRDAAALAAAMRSVDEASFARLRDGALRAFEPFESGRVIRPALDAIVGRVR